MFSAIIMDFFQPLILYIKEAIINFELVQISVIITLYHLRDTKNNLWTDLNIFFLWLGNLKGISNPILKFN